MFQGILRKFLQISTVNKLGIEKWIFLDRLLTALTTFDGTIADFQLKILSQAPNPHPKKVLLAAEYILEEVESALLRNEQVIFHVISRAYCC